jgi:hypothetical protein
MLPSGVTASILKEFWGKIHVTLDEEKHQIKKKG